MPDGDGAEPVGAVAQRPKFYERRWVKIGFIGLLLLVFGVWYSERASYSDYRLPPEVPLLQADGVLQLPTGRVKYWSIEIRGDDGKVLYLECEPNEKWYFRDTCLPLGLYREKAGDRVTVTYFEQPEARSHRRVLVGMRSSDGRTLTATADRLAVLRAAREAERRKTWQAQVPLAILITGLVGLLFAIVHGLVRGIVWVVTRVTKA
jgi:hypothetical protein